MLMTLSPPTVDQYEKLASFYLGRHYDLAAGTLKDEVLMYDAKDLCTHAMCVGMTGSGKTGLCLALLEEAAIDGIPAICVDPKGDLGNLLLTFPSLRGEDFLPWVDPGEATRKGVTLETLAADTATRWREGLASWGQSPERIQRFRDSVDITVYTPGSNVGIALTVLRRFDAPPAELLDDADAMRERVTGAASGLLTLMGIDADPLLSPPHILIASIFDWCWRDGKDVTIADLVGLIQRPPIERVGVLDLDTFMPASDRGKLAMQLNNLLASPAFSTWLEGESLSIERLLHTADGKPRLSIVSIAHLSDRERMFFVTILLNELLAWMRTQSGTSSLRAMFYMDEVFGYFPPTAVPPSKPPMLALLKQARAFGLGITLATQNPVDLDYKGLANIGTWFLGRLQTERDKARVMDGLEGASIQSGAIFDRREVERMLSGLTGRVFLMNNVHDDGPSVFQSRWAMSYMAGPLARDQISRLMADRRERAKPDSREREHVEAETLSAAALMRPVVPAEIDEKFLRPSVAPDPRGKLIYRPSILGEGSLHYVRLSAGLDHWVDFRALLRCGNGIPADGWESSEMLAAGIEPLASPDDAFTFTELPNELRGAATFKRLAKQLVDYLYRHHSIQLYRCRAVGKVAPPGMSEGEARVYFSQALRELRDRETARIRDKFAVKAKSLDKKIRTAADRLDRERAALKEASVNSAITIGTSILGAFFGNKVGGRASASSKTTTAVRGATKAAEKKGDVDRAHAAIGQLQLDLEDLNTEIKIEIDAMVRRFDPHVIELEEMTIAPRKSDLKTKPLVLLWTPWQIDDQGMAEPLDDVVG